MISLIRKILLESLNKKEIFLFNKINEKQKELKTKKNIIDYIRDISKFMGIDPDHAHYYYRLWKANYRKKGGYENIPDEEFIGPKKLPPIVTTNKKAYEMTKAKAPFRGSNLYGEWKKDPKGVEYYIVISYGWYPIYLFKENVWYRIINNYSSSTSRQLGAADPTEYDEKIGRDIIFVTKPEMEKLMNGATYEQIMREKRERLESDKSSFISKKSKFAKSLGWGVQKPPIKIKFKITDINIEGDKAVVNIEIDDAGLREKKPDGHGGTITTNRMIPSEGGYLKGEIPDTDKKRVETIVQNHILSNFKEYVGKYPPWAEEGFDLSVTPEKRNIDFKFVHSKE